MPPLNSQQLNEFLTSGKHLMKLATLSRDGWPQVNPVWYHFDGEHYLVAGRIQASWVDNIRGSSRVSVCIDTCDAPYTRVIVGGSAEIADDNWFGDWESWSIRYLGEQAGHRYYEETRNIPRVLVRITPVKTTTWGGAVWHPRYTR